MESGCFMSIKVSKFKRYSETYCADLIVDEEPFTVLFRVVNETLDNQEIFEYEKEDVIITRDDTIRMEIERIFHEKKDETLEIARIKPGFYDRLLAHLIRYFIENEKKWLRKAKKTKIVANYKSFKMNKSVPPSMSKESETPKNESHLLNEKF